MLPGYIYKTSVKSGDTEIVYKHEFGVNTAQKIYWSNLFYQ